MIHILLPKADFLKTFLFSILCLGASFIANAQDRPFITIWQTENIEAYGAGPDNEIIIPAIGTNYLIEWEEVGNEENNQGSETATDEHTLVFPSAGTYRVKISGALREIKFAGDDRTRYKIKDIEQWGDIEWLSFEDAFHGCVGLGDISAIDAPDLSNVSDVSFMFYNAYSFNGDLSAWDMSGVSNMMWMFASASSFNSDISNWDVSNVTTIRYMFSSARNFNSDISGWDVSNVTDMKGTFSGATSFNFDISSWDVSNVTDMGEMFNETNTFNQDLGSWDVSNVTDMGQMFRKAESFNGNISNWNVVNVTNMAGMFADADSFNQDLNNWDVSNVNNMLSMFNHAEVFNGNISDWNVSNVEDMLGMFALASSFNQDISNWDVSSVNNMESMFLRAYSFNQDISRWNVSKVRNMKRIFNLSGLNSNNYDQTLNAWSELDTVQSNVELGAEGLSYCSGAQGRNKLTKENGWTITGDMIECPSEFISVWKTDNEGGSEANFVVLPFIGSEYSIYWEEIGNTENNGQQQGGNATTIAFPTAGTYRLKVEGELSEIDFSVSPDKLKLIEIENWGESKWTSMRDAFSGAKNLKVSSSDAPDLSLAEDISGMFQQADSANPFVANWDVSNVTNMTNMFRDAKAFNQDISGWNTTNVIDLSGMFYNAVTFDQNLGNWNLSNAHNLFEMFTNTNLSVQNYDLTLEGWVTNGNIPTDITLSAEGLYYCSSAEYRQQLIDNFGWNIIGDNTCSLVLEKSVPAAEETSVAQDTEIYLIFDQEINEVDFSGVQIKDASGNSVSVTEVYIDSLTLHIEASILGFNTFGVTIPAGSIVSETGKFNEAISWSFATQSILSAKEQKTASELINYPNPFSDFTFLEFEVEEQQSVIFRIYDLKGKLMRQQTYGQLDAGNQSITFEREDLPSGLYYYQLQTAEGVLGGRMLIY
jgi:surface protein